MLLSLSTKLIHRNQISKHLALLLIKNGWLKHYAKNYLINIPELSINREETAGEIADKVEKSLKDVCFDQRPPASVIAQKARMSVSEDPGKKFIKLG